jgi:hypothetical protein
MNAIPGRIFAPGSIIPITIEINNRSDRNVEKIVLKLKQTVLLTRLVISILIHHRSFSILISDFSYKEGRIFISSHIPLIFIVAEASLDGIRANESKTVVEELIIPVNLVSSNETMCRVAKVSYKLSVRILSTRIRFPITIEKKILNEVLE